VRLLFDENLSYRLVQALADVYPGSLHVRDVGLESADDATVWEYAREHRLTIISKDSDFHQRSFVFGAPPKVVWVQRGNCSTSDIQLILRRHKEDLEQFALDSESAFLALE
jgi:predicted nuclease of predicted toxin-antitoxin system